MSAALAVASWAAVAVGFTGAWVAAKHRIGWLIGAAGALLWLIVNMLLNLPAGEFASLVSYTIGLRNYVVATRRAPVET